MIFDVFHSISDPVIGGRQLGSRTVFENTRDQAVLAESLGFDTFWLAESHFSSEVQKQTSLATIPNFSGEVGLNSDSFQLIQWLVGHTRKLNFGTGIHNIVGGSGGPIASADRANFIAFLNEAFWERTLHWGVASGRFPYQNAPFGLVPRDATERDFWPSLVRFAFLEALEIFLRLLSGEVLNSDRVGRYEIGEGDLIHYGARAEELRKKYTFPIPVKPRWSFESLQLVPNLLDRQHLRVVLGSSDPRALETGWKFWDLDLFNLSFTPPERIQALHEQMDTLCKKTQRAWHRSRLPRTVLTFVDPDSKKAHVLAHEVLDTYIEAMRGTAQVPDKNVLLERALIGDAVEVREQLHPENPRGIHADDRLMLWFEFNQNDGSAICRRMKYFMEEVAARL
ncbi:MAG: LLM class flavin-dependent oxidoreductase [Bdellovibrionales bacterium]|nr:LLM class flavin-dependent oxidoreductase [Bdellovibrionales bacterium]